MELFSRRRWRLYQPKWQAVVFMTNQKNYAALARHHSIHVWLLGQFSCSSPSTKELHASAQVKVTSCDSILRTWKVVSGLKKSFLVLRWTFAATSWTQSSTCPGSRSGAGLDSSRRWILSSVTSSTWLSSSGPWTSWRSRCQTSRRRNAY